MVRSPKSVVSPVDAIVTNCRRFEYPGSYPPQNTPRLLDARAPTPLETAAKFPKSVPSPVESRFIKVISLTTPAGWVGALRYPPPNNARVPPVCCKGESVVIFTY